MNDTYVNMDVDLDLLRGHRAAIDYEDFKYLMEGILFSSLTVLWGCDCYIEPMFERRAVEIRIRCPVLLARGIEQKLRDIMVNPADRTMYEVDSYPQERRLQINRPQGGMQAPRADGFTPAYGSDTFGGYGERPVPTAQPRANEHIDYVEVPKPEKVRIITIDIK